MDNFELIGKRDNFLQCSPLSVGDFVILASLGPLLEVIEIGIKK